MEASGRPHRREAPIFYYLLTAQGPLGSNQGTFREAPPTNQAQRVASRGPEGGPPKLFDCTGALWALLGQIRGLSGGASRRETPPRGSSDKSGPEKGPPKIVYTAQCTGTLWALLGQIRGLSGGPPGEGGPSQRPSDNNPPPLFNCTGALWALLGQIRGLSGGRTLRQIGGPRGRRCTPPLENQVMKNTNKLGPFLK